jgi:hypothetical protein
MSTPHCPVCGRWNDPTGGPDSHSGGCPETGKPYPGSQPDPQRFVSMGTSVYDPDFDRERVDVWSSDRYTVQP